MSGPALSKIRVQHNRVNAMQIVVDHCIHGHGRMLFSITRGKGSSDRQLVLMTGID